MNSDQLPEPSAAMETLARRQRMAVGMLVFRILLLSLLSGILRVQMPWLRSVEAGMDAMAGVLALWPFWTAVGRNWQWRIALGSAYVNAGRFPEAVAVLGALDGIQGKLFDARGDGAKALSTARKALA